MSPAPLWVQGRLIETPETQSWTPEHRAEAERECKRRVYQGFGHMGADIPLVAVFERPEDATLGAAAPSLLRVCAAWDQMADALEHAARHAGPLTLSRLRAQIAANRAAYNLAMEAR